MSETQRLGALIARERKYQGVTQPQLAEEAGVSLASIVRLERGKGVQTATLDRILDKLCLKLSVKRG